MARDGRQASENLPGVEATPRARAKSAVLWGVAGVLSFLVVAQGYLLVGGTIPFRYPLLFPTGVAIGGVVTATAYLTEYRLRAKRRV